MFFLTHLLALLILAQSPEQTSPSQPVPPMDATAPKVLLEWRILQLDREIKLPVKTPPEIKRLMKSVRSQKPTDKSLSPEPKSSPECEALSTDFIFDDFVAALETKYKAGPKPWRVLAMPRVVSYLSQEAEVAVGRQIPYMVRQDDGSFILEHSPKAFEGMTTTLLVDRGDEQIISIKKAQLRISRIVGRQPIEDLPFDVGYPIVNTREVHTALRVQSGKWVLFLLPAVADDDPLILAFFRARMLDPGSQTEPAIP